MIVIADATPLRYLIEIDSSAILPKLFGRILVPVAVTQELQQPRTPEVVRVWMSAPPSWLEVHTISSAADESLRHLGAGEREAILLAQEVGADWLILDDAEGRREAARRHLPVLGTLRVLDEAAARGLIKLADTLAKLRQTTFYLSPELMKWLLDRDDSRRGGLR
jgi:predicted nucleic acid-binding protein